MLVTLWSQEKNRCHLSIASRQTTGFLGQRVFAVPSMVQLPATSRVVITKMLYRYISTLSMFRRKLAAFHDDQLSSSPQSPPDHPYSVSITCQASRGLASPENHHFSLAKQRDGSHAVRLILSSAQHFLTLNIICSNCDSEFLRLHNQPPAQTPYSSPKPTQLIFPLSPDQPEMSCDIDCQGYVTLPQGFITNPVSTHTDAIHNQTREGKEGRL